MIIECINCNKKFNVNIELIPESGRQIQCGSCNHSWFYKVEKTVIESLILQENNHQEEKISKVLNDHLLNTDNNKRENISSKKTNITKQATEFKVKIENEIKTNIIRNFFSYLVLFVFSLVALIILLDTFKLLLINIFPGLEIFLFNLFEIFKDIQLFIIDLT